jgi:aminopeptidase N
MFDLTFHTPEKLTFATVGEKVSASEADKVETSRWVTRNPAPHMSFNLGDYETYEINYPGIPATTVLMVDYGVRESRSGLGAQASVGADIANSLTFFHEMFGKPPAEHFYAIEIPALHGQACPGLVQLSEITFGTEVAAAQRLKPGEDALFRAHEIAHQWWGMGVGFATYHDQWVNEGMSQFAGLWYIQAMLNKRKEYVNLLKEWRKDIYDREGKAGPIWLGQRVATTKHPEDYQLMTYLKGAWVIHMLRVMMQDESPTGDERFASMLRAFYATHLGSDATTEQFKATAEKHFGEPLDWFFDQWVYGTNLPTYEFSHNTEESGGEYITSVRIEQINVPEDFRMPVPVMLDFGDDRRATFPILVTGPVTEADLPAMPWKPKKVVLNPDESVLAQVKQGKW